MALAVVPVAVPCFLRLRRRRSSKRAAPRSLEPLARALRRADLVRAFVAVLAAWSYFMPWTPLTDGRWGGGSLMGETILGLDLLGSWGGREPFWVWMISIPVLCVCVDSVRRVAPWVRRGIDRVSGAEAALAVVPRLGIDLAALLLWRECLSELATSEPWGVGMYLVSGSALALILVDVVYAPASIGWALWRRSACALKSLRPERLSRSATALI